MFADTLTDEAIEAFFSGTPSPGWDQEESLVLLANDVALAVSGPSPAADHALLQLFWATEAPSPATANASRLLPAPVGGDRRSVPQKLAGRLRLATGVLVASVTALTGIGVAGAAGMLPAPAQRAVARLVEAVTPLELPEPPSDHSTDPADKAPNDDGAQRSGASVPGPDPAPGAGVAPVPPPPAPSLAPTPPGPSGPGATGTGGTSSTPAGHSSGSPATDRQAPTTGVDRARETPAAPYVPSDHGPPAGSPGPPAGTPRGRP